MRLRIFVTLTLAVVILLGAGVGAVAATDDAADRATDAAEDELADAEDEQTYLIEIDSRTRVVDVEFRDGRAFVTLESDISRQIALTDVSRPIDGAHQINYEVMRIPQGTTEVSVEIWDPSNGAVTVTAGSSMVGIGDNTNTQMFSFPATWTIVQATGAFTAGGVGGGVVWWARRKQDDETSPDVERIA